MSYLYFIVIKIIFKTSCSRISSNTKNQFFEAIRYWISRINAKNDQITIRKFPPHWFPISKWWYQLFLSSFPVLRAVWTNLVLKTAVKLSFPSIVQSIRLTPFHFFFSGTRRSDITARTPRSSWWVPSSTCATIAPRSRSWRTRSWPPLHIHRWSGYSIPELLFYCFVFVMILLNFCLLFPSEKIVDDNERSEAIFELFLSARIRPVGYWIFLAGFVDGERNQCC